MKRGESRILSIALGLAGVAVLCAAPAGAFGMATFADPTVGQTSVTPMFVASSGTITGGYTGTNLNLELDEYAGAHAGSYSNVIFEFDPLTYTGTYLNGSVNGGEFRFYLRDTSKADQKGDEIFSISFDSAYLSRSSLGADNIFSDTGVTFAVYGQPLDLDEESFSFSFANQTLVPNKTNPTGFSATAAMAASATPEPATLSILLLGIPLLGIRRGR
jgi:hypothetical protein